MSWRKLACWAAGLLGNWLLILCGHRQRPLARNSYRVVHDVYGSAVATGFGLAINKRSWTCTFVVRTRQADTNTVWVGGRSSQCGCIASNAIKIAQCIHPPRGLSPQLQQQGSASVFVAPCKTIENRNWIPALAPLGRARCYSEGHIRK